MEHTGSEPKPHPLEPEALAEFEELDEDIIADYPKVPIDFDSMRADYGLTMLDGIQLAYIFRQDEKYCSLKIIEHILLMRYPKYLHPEVYSDRELMQPYPMTAAEAKLFNTLYHDSKGCEMTDDDCVVKLADAWKLCDFLEFAYRKLTQGTFTDVPAKCGFVRVNECRVVSYVKLHDNRRVSPSFYFDAFDPVFDDVKEEISGWDLVYMKFAMRVQGIQDESLYSEAYMVVPLTNVIGIFPESTRVEEYWPLHPCVVVNE